MKNPLEDHDGTLGDQEYKTGENYNVRIPGYSVQTNEVKDGFCACGACGWICPRCGSGNNPDAQRCPCVTLFQDVEGIPQDIQINVETGK